MAKEEFKEERMKILDLLSKGVITVDDAQRLLEAISEPEETQLKTSIVSDKKAPFRMLKIFIESNDGDDVKIQIPVEFARLLKTGKINMGLSDSDIDIDGLIEMIEAGIIGEIVNIKSSEGDNVRIFIE